MIKNQIQVVIADDNNFFCEALKDSLNVNPEINIKATFTTLDNLISYTQNYNFDVLILDVNFNGKSSLEHLDKIKNVDSKFKIISLTTLNNNYIKQEAITKGVDSFIGKDSDLSKFKEVILDCFYTKEKVISEKKSSKITIDNLLFTNRKLEILQALYKYSGKKEKELSSILNISESSLKTHKRELFEITNTKNTPELIKFGIQKGIIIA